MRQMCGLGDSCRVDRTIQEKFGSRLRVGGTFHLLMRDKHGNLKFVEHAPNIWVNAGIEYLLNVLFKTATRIDPLYLGLRKDSASPADGWTMADNNGTTWDEWIDYNNATRPEAVDGTLGTKQLDLVATPSYVVTTGGGTVRGAFITTINTKDGTTGVLIASGNFGTPRPTSAGDTLQLTYTTGAQDDGA